MKTKFTILTVLFLITLSLSAGNPDRQGSAGAAQLLMNPWAQSSGLHSMTTSCISGVEAMELNIAGISRVTKTEVLVGQTKYLSGTDINLNALGLVQKIGKSGFLGLTLMAVDMGDIPVTTELQPDGDGTFFSPTMFNLGVGYSHIFSNRISVGFGARFINEGIKDVNASGLALDAGVQYVTGEKENFKFGIAMRNIGSPMSYAGEGLSFQFPVDNPDNPDPISAVVKPSPVELPTVLNIGLSYDIHFGEKHKVTLLTNFLSNSFSRDNIGGGLEYKMGTLFALRAGYKYEIGAKDYYKPVYTGLAAGASIQIPMNKAKSKFIGVDYGYRDSRVWNGSHNISLKFTL